MISQRAIDLIVASEVSSKAIYEAKYHHPEWPGGASGVTIGIGYDLGYADLAKLHADWGGKLPADMLHIMERCLGITGEAARQLLPSVRSQIDVPWDAAMAVFLERDIPEWTAKVIRSIPEAANLPPDSLGAVVSLAYNRGASFDNAGPRYTEMRSIKAHITSGNLAAVPNDFRAMKRLWPGVKGLLDRRDAEDALFEQGIGGLPRPELHDSAWAQRSIAKLGFPTLKAFQATVFTGKDVDGLFGPKTRAAIETALKDANA